MTSLLVVLSLLGPAWAGDVSIDIRVPARIAFGGEIVGDLFVPGRIVLTKPPGTYALVATIAGEPWRQEIMVPARGDTRVLVTAQGITPMDAPDVASAEAAAGEPMTFTVRSAGTVGLMLVVDGARHRIPAASTVDVDLAQGDHPIAVRSHDGGVVYAKGVLRVTRGGRGVLQLVEGAAPEASGEGVSFILSGG